MSTLSDTSNVLNILYASMWDLGFSCFWQSDRKPCIFLKPTKVHVVETLGLNSKHGQQNRPCLTSLPHNQSFFSYHCWRNALPWLRMASFGLGRFCCTTKRCPATPLAKNDLWINSDTTSLFVTISCARSWAITNTVECNLHSLSLSVRPDKSHKVKVVPSLSLNYCITHSAKCMIPRV